MEPGEAPSQSPHPSYYDAASLLGASPYGSSLPGASPYGALSHLPSAFSVLSRPPGLPHAPFGGLGALSDGLGSLGDGAAASLPSPNANASATTGGGEWWLAASEQARRLASLPPEPLLGGVSQGGDAVSPTGNQGNSALEALYRQEAKSLNGLYQGMFQLPTLTSSITTATTSSVTASSKSSSSVASLTRSPSPASPTKKRPSSTTSSHEAEREGSSRTRGTEPKSREPKERESPKITMDAAVAMDIAAGYPHLFPYPIGAGAGMFPPSIFGYPYAAGYPGTPMFPGLYQPYAAPSSPTVSSHSPSHKSSSSASGRSSTTTSVTMTTASSSVSHSSSPAPSSRKSLFDAMGHSDGTSRPEVLSIPKLTQHLDRASQKKSPKKPGVSDMSDMSSNVSDDSLADVSDSEDDAAKAKRNPDFMQPVDMSLKSSSSSSSIPQGMTLPLKRPSSPVPDEIQDLSMKKRPPSEPTRVSTPSSQTSSSNAHQMSSASGSTSSHQSNSYYHDSPHQRSSSRESPHQRDSSRDSPHQRDSSKDSSSSHQRNLAAESAEQAYAESLKQYEMQLAAAMATQQQAELFAAAHMPGKMTPHMFMHPAAAAMMFPPGMLDGSANLLLGPPPPSSRGRGRGRGSRGGSRGSGSGRARGRGRGRGRAASFASRMLQLSEDEAVRRKQEQMREKLREELLRQQTKFQDKNSADAKPATPEQQPMENQMPPDHFKTSRMGINKLRMQGSKLAQALMGQNVIPDGSMTDSSAVSSSTEHSLERDHVKEADAASSDASSVSSSSSSSESETDSESEAERSSQASDGLSTPGKMTADELGNHSDGIKKRRRRHIVDETEARIPLEHGWRRQTVVRTIGPRGLVGEVVYFAPCGKRLKTIPDVLRYLQKNSIVDLQRDNFTFSMNTQVGEYLEARASEPNGFAVLTEDEVADRFMAVQARKQQKEQEKIQRAQRRLERRQQVEEMTRQMQEARAQKKVEQQEMARRIAEMKLRRKLERQQARDMARQAKQQRVEEMRKLKEQQRMLRHQEKVQQQERLRMERELRTQQLIEDREMKRQQAIVMREQEQEQRKNMLVMIAVERERRRQHMLLVKALESRKKQEEREKIRMERIAERERDRERKMEQRRHEYEMAQALRKPVEDMLIKDHKDMPVLDRIKGTCLPGKAFADCLMVVEFLHSFKDVLDIDEDNLPTMKSLQASLLDEDEHDEYSKLLCDLLALGVGDPGFANPREGVTRSGEKICDMVIHENNMTEILRIFMRSRNGKDDELSTRLATLPVLSLNVTDRASVLAYLCNELLTSKNIASEIDRNIDSISNLRKDKWVAEGKLRKLRMVQAKKFLRTNNKPPSDAANDDSSSMAGNKDGDFDEENMSGDENNANSEIEEDENISMEELDKKLEKLQKQHDSYRTKVASAQHKLRAEEYGQDRHKRRYWVLPYCGGIFVEGMESGEARLEGWENAASEQLGGEGKKEEKEAMETEHSKVEDIPKSDVGAMGNGVKGEYTSGVKVESNGIKMEQRMKEEVDVKGERSTEVKMEVDSEDSKSICDSVKMESKASVKSELMNGDIKDELVNGSVDMMISGKTDMKSDSVDFESKLESQLVNGVHGASGERKSQCESPYLKDLSSREASPALNLSTQSPGNNSGNFSPMASHASPFRSIESMIGCDSKAESPSGSPYMTGPYMPGFMGSSTPVSAESLLKELSQRSQSQTSQSWFSVLPKKPCDNTSISRPSELDEDMAYQNSPRPMTPGHQYALDQSQHSLADSDNSSFMSTSFNSFLKPYSRSGTPVMMHDGPSESFLQTIQHDKPQPIPLKFQRGWWRITKAEDLKELMKTLHARGIRERNLRSCFEKGMDYACHSFNRNKDVLKMDETEQWKEISSTSTGAAEPETPGQHSQIDEIRINLTILDEVEGLEDRVNGASLQGKGWKTLPRLCENEEERERMPSTAIIAHARDCLGQLETNIERRYLKPPLGRSITMNLANMASPHSSDPVTGPVADAASPTHCSGKDSDDMCQDATAALLRWRQAVALATNASQISMYVSQISSCISWEKSIMKVMCQLCTKDDNEAMLLLCDMCDRGYHTYCFKPPLEDIPSGDWYCHECIAKATNAPCCAKCGKRGGRLVECDHCPRNMHLDCCEPPFPRIPRRWNCNVCALKKNKGKKKKSKGKQQLVDITSDDAGKSDSDVAATPEKRPNDASVAAESDEAMEEEVKPQEKKPFDITDMTPCRLVLLELEKHEDAWPFLLPVKTKQFPTYRKIIKKPMDFQTVRNKLRDSVYKTCDEFASDARLVFDNCQTFNEDDSEVGQCGHRMREFFNGRWSQLMVDR